MEKVIRHLEKLRAKPESYRKRLAFGLSSGITLVIFLFWIASLGTISTGESSVPSPAASIGSSLTGSVSDSFASIKGAFSSLFSDSKNASSSIEVLPGSAAGQNAVQNNQNNQ
jgi:hypothetical protein